MTYFFSSFFQHHRVHYPARDGILRSNAAILGGRSRRALHQRIRATRTNHNLYHDPVPGRGLPDGNRLLRLHLRLAVGLPLEMATIISASRRERRVGTETISRRPEAATG